LIYSKLMTCGSVWPCPVCASKISERRRVELNVGLARWRELSNTVLLVTYTVRHHKGQRLDGAEGLVERLGHAMEVMKSRTSWKRLKKHRRVKGEIRAYEVTHGLEHGWHPHFHVLVFIEGPEVELEKMQTEILEMWKAACTKVGLELPNEHGVD